jgi:hypothetical protein
MSRLDEKGMPTLNKHHDHHEPKAARTDGRNLREDCPDRDKPCETLQTVQRAGRGGRVDSSYFRTNRDQNSVSGVPGCPTGCWPVTYRLNKQGARARAGRRAAGMTQLRLSNA